MLALRTPALHLPTSAALTEAAASVLVPLLACALESAVLMLSNYLAFVLHFWLMLPRSCHLPGPSEAVASVLVPLLARALESNGNTKLQEDTLRCGTSPV